MSNIRLGTSDEIYWWQTTSKDHDYSSLSTAKTNLNPDEREILSKPLLGSGGDVKDGKSLGYDSESESTFDANYSSAAEEQPTSLKYLVVTVLAMAGVTTSLASIALVAGFGLVSGPALFLVLGAGGLTSVMSPIMLSNEKEISARTAKRNAINKLREQANRLSEENQKLKKNNDELKAKVDELKQFEQRLDGIVAQSGASVNEFVKLVKEFKIILQNKQSVVKTIVLQDLIGLLIKQDSNRNFVMDEEEMDQLFLALDTYGVKIPDKNKFRKEAMEDPTIDAVLVKVKKCMDGQDIDENNVMDVREGRGSNVFDAQSLRLSM